MVIEGASLSSAPSLPQEKSIMPNKKASIEYFIVNADKMSLKIEIKGEIPKAVSLRRETHPGPFFPSW